MRCWVIVGSNREVPELRDDLKFEIGQGTRIPDASKASSGQWFKWLTPGEATYLMCVEIPHINRVEV